MFLYVPTHILSIDKTNLQRNLRLEKALIIKQFDISQIIGFRIHQQIDIHNDNNTFIKVCKNV